MIPAGFTVGAVGVPALGAPGVVALGYTFVWFNDLLVFMSAPLANSLRLGSELAGDRRRLLWGLAAAMLISLVLSDLVHAALGLYARSRQSPPAVLFYLCCRAVQVRRAKTTPSHRPGRHWLVVDRRRCAADECADWCAQPLGLVAAASFGLCREHGLGHEPYLVRDFSRLVRQDFGAPLWGAAALYQKTVPFFLGIALGQGRHCGDLARRRWVSRGRWATACRCINDGVHAGGWSGLRSVAVWRGWAARVSSVGRLQLSGHICRKRSPPLPQIS